MRLLQTPLHKLISHIKILRSTTNDIFFNLATQQYLFQKSNLTTPTLFLWQNHKTIVIGRHQNPWKQCKIQKMSLNSIELSRRKTGGGAVYQDMGNSCFSFLTPYQKQQQYDYKTINNKILIKGLKDLGIDAQVAGRNDIHYMSKKISGSAYRLNLGGKQGTGKKALHHGTVMFNVDLSALQQHLNPNKKKLQSKGIRYNNNYVLLGIDSVISRVTNLNQQFPSLTHQHFCQSLSKSFTQHYSLPCIIQTLNHQSLQKQPQILLNYQRLKSWQWRYGQCPSFMYSIQKKFIWGLVEITYNVQNGVIKQAKVYSDCLVPDFITKINQNLIKGVKYDKEGLIKYGEMMNEMYKQKGQNNQIGMIKELVDWMIQEL